MKIGISTSVVQRGKTGIAQYLFALLKALRDNPQGHQFTLFILAEDLPLFEFLGDQVERVVVPEIHRPAVRNILWHQTELPDLARRLRLDLLHIPSYRRLLWQRPCPLVATIHDLAPFRLPGKYDWKRMFYGKVVVRHLARRADQIIAISRNTANDIARFFKPSPDRVTVVHNGLDHSRFFPGPAAGATVPGAAPFFLYVARLEHPAKNHVRLIEAFDRFKAASGSAWQLVFAGSDWHGADQIHQAIGRSRFSRDIRSLGFVPDADLPALYRAAGAFVYPSLYEGFGMPPVEAMACGSPVISSPRGALGEVLGEAAVRVDPEDISAMADALARVERDPALRATLREAGLKQAARFRWENTARQTVRVYEMAARARLRPAWSAALP